MAEQRPPNVAGSGFESRHRFLLADRVRQYVGHMAKSRPVSGLSPSDSTARIAVGYIRVSSEEQADSGLGLEAQRQRIVAYCTMKGLHLAHTFEDPGVSGGKALSTRPAGAALLTMARDRKAVVVVAKFDRLFRSVADAATTIADFDRKGIELVAISEGFDMTNPYGRAMAQMASVFAELERAMIRERTKSAMSVKRDRGERISRYAPYGWDFDEGNRLVKNDREQEAIATMQWLRAKKKSFEKIAATLNFRKIKSKTGLKWSHCTVKKVLRRVTAAAKGGSNG